MMWKGLQLIRSYFGALSEQRLSGPPDITDLGELGSKSLSPWLTVAATRWSLSLGLFLMRFVVITPYLLQLICMKEGKNVTKYNAL